MREATDLLKLIGEHVPLRPKGREHVGLCPFHDDKNPSMAVVTHKGNAFYKCHSCGAGGDAFDFVMNYHKMDFGDALRHLAQKAGITLTPWKREDGEQPSGPKRIDVKKANGFAARFFRKMLADERLGAAARGVIEQRGISDEMVEAFMLGASVDSWDALLMQIRRQNLPVEVFAAAGLLKPRREGEGYYDAFRNRVMFPICNEMGEPIAFGARKINPEDEPKYLNSAESAIFNKSKTLYGLHLAKRAIIEKHAAIITEGYTDVIACHQAGVTNAVATLGTALTREHARVLSKLCDTVILLFDGDEAGMKAADRALEIFFSETVDIKICVLPDGLDPDELLKQEGGRERFDNALAKSVDALQYKLDRFRGTLEATGGSQGGSQISGRQKRLEGFLAELAQIGFASLQGVRKHMVLMRIAELMRLPVGTIEQALARVPQRKSPPSSSVSSAEQQADESGAAQWTQHETDDLDCPLDRRNAEFELLAVALFEPLSAQHLIADRGRNSGDQTVDAPFDPMRFRHPAARSIAAIIEPRVRSGASFTVQQVLAELESEEHRRTATKLFFDGQSLCGDDEQRAAQAIFAAAASVENCMRRERLMQLAAGVNDETAHPLDRLQEVLKHRRAAGPIASAIGQGVRGIRT